MPKRVGFIGLGIMGRPMAKNVLSKGFPLSVYNRSSAAVEELAKLGARPCQSSREVAEHSDVILTCLPDSPDVEQVILGPQGVLEGARPGSIIADMSTIAPQVSIRLAEEAAKRGVQMLDAPVSGGDKGAIAGTLSIMVGGTKEAFDACLDIFRAMGTKIVHVGDIGAGGYTKLANQIMVALQLEAMAEGLVLGAKAGVDPALMVEAIGAGLARCGVLEMRAPNVLEGNFTPGFMIRLHLKDLRLALEAGHALGVPLPVTAVVREMYNALQVAGKGDCDHSAIILLLEDLARVQVRKKSA
ncbi:MAG TPA: 2-hydroxy-3-oxopropionate reductase [Alphaproteobacteria bacterium]|nr:2-hydroxy-3-oxopropionate reductase [Alphaproteobacteria bacterium]